MCKLYFLQVLIGNSRNPIMAKDANKLTNLRRLYGVKEDAFLSVAKVGKLTSLQNLCFSVGTEPGHRIDELMNMNNLHQLKIEQLSNVRSLEEANKVNLIRKRNLTRLELHYQPDGEYHCNEVGSNPDFDPQEVLAALRPPPTIRELFITDYKGGKPAPWMDNSSLSLLTSLELSGCTSLEELPPLWKLSCLKFLKLNQMKAIKSLGGHSDDQMDIQFPGLEKLKFVDLPLLEEWNGADDYKWFPRLKNFEICDCPELKKIPDLSLSVENFCMRNSGLEALPRSYDCSNGSRIFGGFQQLISLESLEIYDCPMIVQIGSICEEDDNLLPSSLKKLELGKFDKCEDLASYLRGLTSLTDLSFSCSPGMESLPLVSELEHLTALQNLRISDGEALTSPGGLYIIKSLEYLWISDCPKFLSAEVESQEYLKDKTKKHAESSSSVFDQCARNKAASILPSSLVSLQLKNSHILQQSLGRCLPGLTSLEALAVSGCHHLVSLPNVEYLQNLTALQRLRIYDCEELRELESLTALVSLKQLNIDRCPKLLAATFSTIQNPATTTEQSATKIKKGTLPSLEEIAIDSFFYIPNLPTPVRLKSLWISIENHRVPVSEFTRFPSEMEEWLLQYRESLDFLDLVRMPHLQSLPSSLESFSSLRMLRIHFAPELKSLPRMPASLVDLTILENSAKLKKRCQENIGPDWPNIKHIPDIYFPAGKEDKEEAQVNCDWVSSRLCSST